MEKLLGFHQQWAFYLDILADILLRKVVHGKGAHGKPNNLIAVVMDAINEVVVPMMEIIIAHIIIVESSNVVLGEGAVYIADDEPVLISVQVYLSRNGKFLNLVLDGILSVFQVQ